MTTHDAYPSATVAANEVTIRNQTAALAAKDTEIASLRTRLDAYSQREGDLLQRAADNLRVANERADRIEELLQSCREKNRRIADLEEQCDRLIHSPVQNELAAIHAAHRAAVVRWSDAEAEVKEYAKALNIMHQQAAFGSPSKHLIKEQEQEIKRLKTRINQLIGSVHNVGSVFRAWVPENL